jgi:type I restriction enzyme R subunit
VPENNDWLAVNQFTVSEGQHTRRPDVVLFVNGLPLAVIELKSPADEDGHHLELPTSSSRPTRLRFPLLLRDQFAALIISDGVQARIGALGAGKEWF